MNVVMSDRRDYVINRRWLIGSLAVGLLSLASVVYLFATDHSANLRWIGTAIGGMLCGFGFFVAFMIYIGGMRQSKSSANRTGDKST